MNEMIKAERNKICSRKQTRMLFLAGVVLIVAYFFFFQFNYQNVFYDYDLEKMALASGFTAIEQRKEVAEIFEGKLSQNTLLTMQEKIDQAKQATVGQDENSAFSAVHVYRDQAAILEYLTNSDGSFKSLETAYPNSPTVTLGYCDGWDKLLSGMGSILSIMICLILINNMWVAFNFQNVINKLIYTLTKLNHGWIFDVVVYNSIACRLERHVIGNDLTKCIVKRKHIILSCARYKNIICNVRSIQHGTGNE